MLAIKSIFNQLSHKITMFVLAGLLCLISLPATALAGGYYSGDYSTNQASGETYTESGKRAAEVLPKGLGNGNKDVGERVSRAMGEMTNDQYQRVFGAEDYKRSEAEQQLARNKAMRGDYNQAIENAKR